MRFIVVQDCCIPGASLHIQMDFALPPTRIHTSWDLATTKLRQRHTQLVVLGLCRLIPSFVTVSYGIITVRLEFIKLTQTFISFL